MSLTPDDIAEFSRAVATLKQSAQDLRGREANASTSRSTISVNAGGIGVWAAVTACLMMLAVNMMVIALFVSHDRKISAMQDYLNAIYMQAPQLKPKDAK